MQLIIQPSDRPSRSCPYLLSIALVLSFMQYFWPLESKTLQLIPLAVLLASGYVAFVDCCRKARLGTAVSAVAPIMGTTVLATLISHFVATEEAMLYGILMLVVLAASRFILTSIGFKGVLAAYHWASMASLMIAVIAGLDMIRRAAQGKRLELLAFHPNLIAFTLVSFAVVQVWGWKAGGRSKVVLLGLRLRIHMASSADQLARVAGRARCSGTPGGNGPRSSFSSSAHVAYSRQGFVIYSGCTFAGRQSTFRLHQRG